MSTFSGTRLCLCGCISAFWWHHVSIGCGVTALACVRVIFVALKCIHVYARGCGMSVPVPVDVQNVAAVVVVVVEWFELEFEFELQLSSLASFLVPPFAH